jgi:hypothetical protein
MRSRRITPLLAAIALLVLLWATGGAVATAPREGPRGQEEAVAPEAYTAIAVGGKHTCALTMGGGVKCWGWNYYGQLGDGTTTRSHHACGCERARERGGCHRRRWVWHTCALTVGGGVKCWGRLMW